MGVGHGHGHGAAPADPAGTSGSGRHRWRLALAFGMVAAFFVVELLVGISASSLALISDAGHMAADVVALGAALTAIRIAARPDSSGRRTYGSYRAEIFASGLTVLIMLGVSAYVVVEAVRRIGADVAVASGPMLVVGAIGLLINAASILLLRGGSSESLNVRAAYYEVVADAAGSVGVLAAGGLIVLTGQTWWDTVVALAIGVFVAFRAVVLGRQVLTVLGQHVPDGMDIEQAAADLAAVPGVRDVHDLHAWSLTSGMNVATAHLVIEDDASSATVLRQAQTVLQAKHQIEHATLQVEDEPTRQCHETSW